MKIKSIIVSLFLLFSTHTFAENFVEDFDYAKPECSIGEVDESIHENGYRFLFPKYSFSDIEFYVSDEMGYEWVEYAESAAKEINNIKSNLNVTIVKNRTVNSSVISYKDDLDYCVAAGALKPSRGKIGQKIVINPGLDSYEDKEKIGVLIHEMLHTVGFQHAGTEDGSFLRGSDHIGLWKDARFKPIMRPDTGNYKLTLLDKFSIRRLFPKK